MGKTFAKTKGTVFYRLRTPPDLVVIVVTLPAHGCPLQAIVVAFGLDERTVLRWQARSGKHCQRVHELFVDPRDLGQVQADEIRAKTQGGILWMAMAIQVQTRLWLGGVLSTARDMPLLVAFIERVRHSALVVHCYSASMDVRHLGAIRHLFREPIRWEAGTSCIATWDGISIAQVVQEYAHQHVVAITRPLSGTQAQIDIPFSTAKAVGDQYPLTFERLNATFRSRITALIRRGRALARQTATLHDAMYLVGTVYNFCTYHKNLRLSMSLPNHRHRWLRRTPAIAAASPISSLDAQGTAVFSGTSTALEDHQDGEDALRMSSNHL